MSKDGLHLPCPLEDLECDATSIDPYAYTWDAPDNCLLAIHRREDVNMIKHGKNNYYFFSGGNNTSQYLFELKTKPEVSCNKLIQAYPTNYDSLYVVIDFGGFNLASGKRMGISGGRQHLQYYQPSVTSDGRLFVHKPESPIQISLTQKQLTTSTRIMHCIKKANWIIYFSKAQRCLKAPRYNFKRTYANKKEPKILTILLLSMENPTLAGYMLTGNRSMFLSTHGSLAWLYHCPLMRSPPQVMNQWYDKIPIFYKNAIFFVHPITRETYPDAQVQKLLRPD